MAELKADLLEVPGEPRRVTILLPTVGMVTMKAADAVLFGMQVLQLGTVAQALDSVTGEMPASTAEGLIVRGRG